MSLLHWEDRYSVGVESVDHEHRELIALVNRLYEEASGKGSRDAVLGFFGDLHRAVAAHFALEERFMRERGYAAFADHKRDHERLLDEIRDLMDDYEGDAPLVEAQLAGRLDAWFSRHFETHDARLHRALGDHHA